MKDVIEPLEDRVLLSPEELEDKTPGGIIIPQEAKEKSQIGRVVATGPGTKENPMTLKVGDRVFYSKYGGPEVTYGQKTYLILPTSDVLAKLK